MSGRGTRAIEVARDAGVNFVIHEYDASGPPSRERAGRPSYGAVTVAALGADPERVCKTLIADVDGRLVAAVVPVAHELDLKLLAAALGARRATMADPAAAERATGYVVGGISPLGGRRTLPTVIDASAAAHPTILVSAGRRGLQLELAPADLVALIDAHVAPLTRRP